MHVQAKVTGATMSVKRRRDSDAWEVTVCLPGYPVFRKSDRHWSKRDAQRVELEYLASHSETAPPTLDDAIAQYSMECVERLSDDSKRKTLSHIEAIRRHTNGMLLTDLPQIALRLKRAWAKLAPATVNRRLAILRRVGKLAYTSWEMLDEPLYLKVQLLSCSNERHIYLTRAQIEAIAQALPRDYGDFLIVAAFTGLRQGRLFALNRGDPSIQVVGDVLLFASNTKNKRPAAIPLHPRALNIIRRMPLDVTPMTLRRKWAAVRKTFRLNHVHWHDLRHTWASWLVQKETALNTVKDLMTHKDIKSTLRYAHLSTQNLRTAVKRIKP